MRPIDMGMAMPRTPEPQANAGKTFSSERTTEGNEKDSGPLLSVDKVYKTMSTPAFPLGCLQFEDSQRHAAEKAPPTMNSTCLIDPTTYHNPYLAIHLYLAT